MDIDSYDKESFEKKYEDLAQNIAGNKKAADFSEYNGKAALVQWSEDDIIITDMVGGCKYLTSYVEMPLGSENFANALTADLGKEIKLETLLETAKRIRQLERSFDVREGMTRSNDTLSKRFFEPVSDGRYKGDILDRDKFEKMKDDYYKLRGWDAKTGIPTRKTLEDAGLKDVADDLEKRGIFSNRAQAK
jgi:aldehyde:ferredoxin oxidoreductase